MLFSAYLTMLFVSGHVHGGYIAGMGIQHEQHETERLTESPSTDPVGSLPGKTRRQLGGNGAAASSLAADASSVKASRKVRRDDDVLFDRLYLRTNENAAEIRSDEPEQRGPKSQDASYLPTPAASVVLIAADKDRLWSNIGLVTGVIAALASCIVLICGFSLWLCSRKSNCRQGRFCQKTSATEQQHCTQSSPIHELFVPGGASYPPWQPPPYHTFRHEDQSSGTNSTWMNHNVVSPIESQGGAAPLHNHQPSPIESQEASPVQRPPASYHRQAPVELPATPGPEQTPLPSYREVMPMDGQSPRFSWTQDAEACYRPSEWHKN